MAAATDPGCIFCRIVRGEIPCARVHEDAHLLAFLDIHPLAPGHTVIVPKHHAPSLVDLPQAAAAALGGQLGRLARAILGAVGAAGFNVLQNDGQVASQEVPHVHFHIIPRSSGDGLGYRWRAGAATADELTRRAEQIRAGLA